MKIMKSKISQILTLGLLILPSFALGNTPGLSVGEPSGGLRGSLGSLVTQFITIGTTIGGIIFVLMLLVGGFQYLSSAGDEAKAKQANKTMISAVIGIVIIATAYAVSRYVVVDILRITGAFS